MKLKGIAMLKSLFTNFQREEALLPLLPPELAKRIKQAPSTEITDLSPLLKVEKCLERIHYSWFSPYIASFPEKTRSYLLALFLPTQAKGLGSLLHTPVSLKPPLPFLRPLLADYLKKIIQGEDILDLELLPHSAMNVLLKITKIRLVHLIDFLGIHDLAADLRQVVNNELLKKVYASLTEEQLQFLHYCGKQTLRWVSPKLNLENWDGDKKKLNTLLHKRGLIRLAKGIVDEDSSFRWHLIHRLDAGRGNAILKICAEKYDRETTSYFKGQVIHIIKRYLS